MLPHAELTRIETNAIAVIWFTNRMSTTLNGDRPNLVFGLGPSIYSDKSWHTHSIGSAVTGEAATPAAEIGLDTSVRTAVALVRASSLLSAWVWPLSWQTRIRRPCDSISIGSPDIDQSESLACLYLSTMRPGGHALVVTNALETMQTERTDRLGGYLMRDPRTRSALRGGKGSPSLYSRSRTER